MLSIPFNVIVAGATFIFGVMWKAENMQFFEVSVFLYCIAAVIVSSMKKYSPS